MTIDYPIGFQNYSSSQNTTGRQRGRIVTNTTSGDTALYQMKRQPDSFTEFEAYNTQNWDGEGAEPITTETVEAARRFNAFLPRELRPADIAPGADGTIGFEWREGPPQRRTFVIVEIGPGSVIKARKLSETGRKSRLAPVEATDTTRTQNLISMLFDAAR